MMTAPAAPVIDLTIFFAGMVLFLLAWRLRSRWWPPLRALRAVGADPVRRYVGSAWAWTVVGLAAVVHTLALLTLTGVFGSGGRLGLIFPDAAPEETAQLIVATFDLIVHGTTLCVFGAVVTEVARTALRWKWPRRIAMAVGTLAALAGAVYASVFIVVAAWP